jgi:hypothetical protein
MGEAIGVTQLQRFRKIRLVFFFFLQKNPEKRKFMTILGNNNWHRSTQSLGWRINVL